MSAPIDYAAEGWQSKLVDAQKEIERLKRERDRLRAVAQRVSKMAAQEAGEAEAQLAELQRAKYGTPCKCEAWMETARAAEDQLAEARALLEQAEQRNARQAVVIGDCPDCTMRALDEALDERATAFRQQLAADIAAITPKPPAKEPKP
jgi:DNA repair exonuclease SbcCD ATPase subunit